METVKHHQSLTMTRYNSSRIFVLILRLSLLSLLSILLVCSCNIPPTRFFSSLLLGLAFFALIISISHASVKFTACAKNKSETTSVKFFHDTCHDAPEWIAERAASVTRQCSWKCSCTLHLGVCVGFLGRWRNDFLPACLPTVLSMLGRCSITHFTVFHFLIFFVYPYARPLPSFLRFPFSFRL